MGLSVKPVDFQGQLRGPDLNTSLQKPLTVYQTTYMQ